jgi:hypothetical protein
LFICNISARWNQKHLKFIFEIPATATGAAGAHVNFCYRSLEYLRE